jgi:hypothetical protein
MSQEFCPCDAYVHWYTDRNGTEVCRCGHRDIEHLDKTRMCVGEVERT